jgi:hypothetical protein
MGEALLSGILRAGASPEGVIAAVRRDERAQAVRKAYGVETATVRRWERRDWGAEGTTMNWCCTEEPEAYVGDRPVVESMRDELTEIAGGGISCSIPWPIRSGCRNPAPICGPAPAALHARGSGSAVVRTKISCSPDNGKRASGEGLAAI